MSERPATMKKADMSSKAAASRSKWASLEDWEKVKPLIRQMYVEEDRTLKHVMAIMASKYGHHAT